MSPHAAIDRDFDAHLERIREFLRIPSVSADDGDLRGTADAVCRLIELAGGAAAPREPGERRPTVIGVIDGPGPTVLRYGMYDVQPSGAQWTVDPFAADLRDGRVIARGAANSKAALAASILAFASVPSPCRQVFVCEGEEELDGSAVASKPAWRALRQRVQMVFQDPYQTLNPRMRVSAIVEESLVIAGASDRDARVDRALADVGLPADRFADRYPHELSGGQRQRVAIAAALVLDPEGLICDEPVSMLDVSVRAQVLKVLIDLRAARSLALLFITHDLGLAWTLCDRIAVMYLGRIVEQGTAAQVIENPRHPYTQALVAAVPSPDRERGSRLLAGEPPDATHIPPGCRLHPRCPHRFEPCDSEDPPLFDAGDDGHRAACLLLRRDGNVNGAG